MRTTSSPSGIERIVAEQYRQRDVEGYTAEHDAKHHDDDLALAAACYAIPSYLRTLGPSRLPRAWPWGVSDWKPTPDDRVRELVKAGALIASAIDAHLCIDADELAEGNEV
jgi:hypothetical protein